MKIKYIHYYDFGSKDKISVEYVTKNGLKIECEVQDTQAILAAIDKITRPLVVKKINEISKSGGDND